MINDDEICFKMFSANERLWNPEFEPSVEDIVDYR